MKTAILDDPKQLQTMFDDIASDFAAIDYTAWMQNELDLLADLHKSYFTSSSGPDGNSWTPNAPSTIAQKGHATILRGVRGRRQRTVKATRRQTSVRPARGRWIAGYALATSLTLKSHQSFGDAIREAVDEGSGAMLKFGTDLPYSVWNDQGTSRIPARPHIGMDNKYLDGITNRVADYTLTQLAK